MKVYWVWVDLVEDSEGKQACCGVEKFLLFFFLIVFFYLNQKICKPRWIMPEVAIRWVKKFEKNLAVTKRLKFIWKLSYCGFLYISWWMQFFKINTFHQQIQCTFSLFSSSSLFLKTDNNYYIKLKEISIFSLSKKWHCRICILPILSHTNEEIEKEIINYLKNLLCCNFYLLIILI